MASVQISEAREAHAYWSRRAASLPWRKRAARREARELASRWRVRLVTAYLDAWHLGPVAHFLAPLFDTRGRSPRRHVGLLAFGSVRRTSVGRLLLAAVAGIVTIAFASVVLVVAVVAHLAWTCPGWESNPHCAGLKSAVSASWTTRARTRIVGSRAWPIW